MNSDRSTEIAKTEAYASNVHSVVLIACSRNVSKVKLVNGIVQLGIISFVFSMSFSLLVLITEKSVEISIFNCGFLYLFFQFCQIFFM